MWSLFVIGRLADENFAAHGVTDGVNALGVDVEARTSVMLPHHHRAAITGIGDVSRRLNSAGGCIHQGFVGA